MRLDTSVTTWHAAKPAVTDDAVSDKEEGKAAYLEQRCASS